MHRRQGLQLVVIGVVLSLIGIAIALSIHWFPPAATSQAKSVDTLYDVLLIVTVPIFVLVEVVVLFSVWKFRMRPGQELQDGPPIHGNTRLEVLWTAGPAILLISLASYAYVVLHHIEKHKSGELVVDVTGQQFAWSFAYPQADGKTVNSDELYLPKGRPVHFRVHSKDVIHAFWVPAFRIQVDAVPGQTDDIRAQPTRTGSYPVVCAELCGLGHSTMRSTVHVMAPAAFEAWLNRQTASASGQGAAAAPATGTSSSSTGGKAPAGGGPAAVGKQVFVGQGGCGACHRLADAGTSGTTGPDLDQGLKGKTVAYIMQSIVSPNAVITPGYPANVMPQTFAKTLTKSQIAGLVAYLSKLTK